MDNRTKREKLEAMANQAASPQEAEIARKKLTQLDAKDPPKFQYNASYDTFQNEVVFTFFVNGQKFEMTREDILNGKVPPMPSGARVRSNPYATSVPFGTIPRNSMTFAFTASYNTEVWGSHDGKGNSSTWTQFKRPSFNFRKK